MFKKNRFVLLIIMLSVIPAALPFLRTDYFHFSDEPNISIIYEMYRAFKSGQFPPRWAPDMSYEYGYPLFNFYYVLPYYMGALIYGITHSLILATKLSFFLTIPASALAMYFFLRESAGKLVSLVGAVIYIYTPYRAVDLYVRGAIGENLAFVFFPLIALFTMKAVNSDRARFIGLLGLSVGLLILSHNLAPMFFLPWSLLYGIIISFKKFDPKKILRLFMGYGLGFAMASYFWVPAFLEKGLLVSQTPFNYIDHFPFIKQLIYSPFRYGASLPGINDDISLQVGIVNWVLIILAGIIFIKSLLKRKEKPYLLGYFLSSTCVLLFLMNIRSSFLWELSSLSGYIQFPWRLLMLTTFLSSSMVVFLSEKANKFLIFGLALAVMIINFGYFRPSEYFQPDDNYYLNRMLPCYEIEEGHSVCSTDYHNYSEDFLLLPIWVNIRPSSVSSGFYTSSKGLNIVKTDKSSDVNFYADVEGSGLLQLQKYYFPGWYATVNDKPTELKVIQPYGNMGVDIEDGFSSVNIVWKETPLRKTLDLVSLASFTTILIFILLKRGKLKLL